MIFFSYSPAKAYIHVQHVFQFSVITAHENTVYGELSKYYYTSIPSVNTEMQPKPSQFFHETRCGIMLFVWVMFVVVYSHGGSS